MTAVPRSGWQVLLDRQLALRVASGIALAVVAVGGAVMGGWWAAAVAAFFTVAIHQEWTWLTEESRHPAVYYTVALVIALVYVAAGLPQTALVITGIAIATAAVSSGSAYRAIGVAYAAMFGLSLLIIRGSGGDEPDYGLAAVLFIFAVVWATDSVAYFVGRVIGGPRLWPAVSPNKTWAGAVGGLVGGVIGGLVIALIARLPITVGLIMVAALLALAAEAGDLFESWLKRQVGEKDSGWLLPGHGGFMDRTDSLVFASGAALLIGWLHGGAEAIASGLVQW